MKNYCFFFSFIFTSIFLNANNSNLNNKNLTLNRTEIKLLLKNGTQERFAKIYYINGTTTGFDSGYDGATFGGIANALDIYTQLVDRSSTTRYQIQSLPDTNITNYVVPVGVTASSGEILNFSTVVKNLPTNIKVYLEDRVLGKFIRLDETTTSYNISVTAAMINYGRFYLHTSTILLGKNIFTGTGNWSESTKWSQGKIPFSGVLGENIKLAENAALTIDVANTIINELEIPSTSIVNLNADSSLTINGDVTQNGSLTINSNQTNSGSLILKRNATGNLRYNRKVTANNASNLDGWYLVAAPFAGQLYNDFWLDVLKNDIASGSGMNRGIGLYNSSVNSFVYHKTGESNTFFSGKGYAVKRNSTGFLSFKGTANTSDNGVDFTVVNGFNLVGNPYSAFINTKEFLQQNINLSQQIWVFNSVTKNYEVKIIGSTEIFQIAPGQGFFIKTNSGTNINFSENLQSHQTSNTFLKPTHKEIQLNITNGSAERFAKIYFTENATLDFDAGLEGETFGGLSSDFDIFSYLVEGNSDKKYQIQSLGNSALESVIVPLGLISDKGKKIIFSVTSINLSKNINLILEDRLLNIFKTLDKENEIYEVVLNEKIDARFFLHISTKLLNIDDNILSNVGIYKTSRSTLKIDGLETNKVFVEIFNLLGQKVVSRYIETETKDLSIENLKSGIYIVQLQTIKGKLIKKISID